MVNTLLVRRCLIISAFTALNIAMKSYAWERRQLGTLSYSVIRDELDTTFFRLALFLVDVAGHLIAPLLASLFIGAIIGSLLSGYLDRLHTLAYTATLVTTTASTVSVFAAEIHTIGTSSFLGYSSRSLLSKASWQMSVARSGSQATTASRSAPPLVQIRRNRSRTSLAACHIKTLAEDEC